MGKQLNTYVFYVTINNSALKHQGIVRADSKDLAYEKIFYVYIDRLREANSFEVSLEWFKEIV
jgi:hypothetical protein